MSSVMRMVLKAGDKIYVNGAVLQVDRKVSLQILNNATFLLGSHVLQAEEATTPLRQLYFVTQTLLMDPDGEGNALALFEDLFAALQAAFENQVILSALDEIGTMVRLGRCFNALKRIRELYPLEQEILAAHKLVPLVDLSEEGSKEHGRDSSEPVGDPVPAAAGG